MNRNQRHPQSQSRALGEVHPHQHCADQTGSISYSNAVKIPPGQTGGSQGLICQIVNDFDVFPGSNFRHHTAVKPVQIHLRGDAIRQNMPPIFHQGNCSFIAGGFYSQ